MPQAETVALRYTADLIAFKAKLEEMPGITGDVARRAVSRYEREWGRLGPATTAGLTRATQAVGSAHQQMSVDVDRASTALAGHGRMRQAIIAQTPDMISGLVSGNLTFAYFSQQALQVVEMTGGLEKGLGGAAGAIGPVAVGLAAVATVAAVVANRISEARDATRAYNAAMDGTLAALPQLAARTLAAAHAWSRIASVAAEAQQALLLERGELTETDVAQMKAAESIRAAARAKILLVATSWAQIEVQRQELAQAVEGGNLTEFQRGLTEARIDQLDEQAAKAKTRLEALKDEVASEIAATQATIGSTAALKAEAKAQVESAAAGRKAGQDKERAKEQELADLFAGIKADQEAAADAEREEVERFNRMSELKRETRLQDEAWEQELARRRVEREQAVAQSEMDSVQSMLDGAGAAAATLSDTLAAQGKKGALALWVVSKAAAAAQIALSGVVAVAKAWELGPFVGALAAGAVAAEFAALAAQIAASEPPAFPTGGLVGARATAAGHVLIQAEPSEGIVTRRGVQALGGEAGLRRVNRGEGPGGGPVVVGVPVFGAARHYQRDELRRSGQLRRALSDAARGNPRVRLGR